MARSRGQAREWILAGLVRVAGEVASKPGVTVADSAVIEVAADPTGHYVGRGALKLADFLDQIATVAGGISPAGLRCLDVGASTGGFTQVLLERQARSVAALDVGHGQLAEVLRRDRRVTDFSGRSIRGLPAQDVAGPFDLLVTDLSFISLLLVLPEIAALVKITGDAVLLVKPQFEVGREHLGSSGVVRSPELQLAAIERVAHAGIAHGLLPCAIRASRWPGSTGNVEFFIWFRRVDSQIMVDSVAFLSQSEVTIAARRAIEEGTSSIDACS